MNKGFFTTLAGNIWRKLTHRGRHTFTVYLRKAEPLGHTKTKTVTVYGMSGVHALIDIKYRYPDWYIASMIKH